jgi:hypothetical protein
MGKGLRKSITIRGVEYSSQREAALALGISAVAINRAKTFGRLDTVGLNPARRDPVPVTIRGVLYPSEYAAAKAFGVRPNTIYKALESGTLDNVGTRKGTVK